MPVLDHLLGELAAAGRFDLALEIAPDEPEAEVDAAGRALGEAVRSRPRPARTASAPSLVDEALAHVVVEASGRPPLHSNADLTGACWPRSDLAARFLGALAGTAGLTLHVRLLEGEETDHVLEAIFKSPAALAAAERS